MVTHLEVAELGFAGGPAWSVTLSLPLGTSQETTEQAEKLQDGGSGGEKERKEALIKDK